MIKNRSARRLTQTVLLSVLMLGMKAREADAAVWLTDLAAAKQQAKRENKQILLDFTGSDWCGWCKKLKAEVFDQPDFNAYADAHLVLVEVDFPRMKKLSPEQRRANDELADQFKVRGYPSLVVLNSSGVQVGETGYHPGGPKVLISQLEQMTGTSAQLEKEKKADPASNGSLFPWLAANARAKPVPATEIRLKGLTGRGKRPMALINKETLAAGDTARLEVAGKFVRVQCLEVRTTSVLLKVEGEEEPRELKLGMP